MTAGPVDNAAVSESLAMRARDQLQRCSDLRAGVLASSMYEFGLTGGTSFPRQLRSMRKHTTLASDESYLEFEAEKMLVCDLRV